MSDYFDREQQALVREVNAAVMNISGRQRMLCQRAALYALRLVHQPESDVRQELLAVVDCLARSHQGLIHGNPDLKLPGKVSPAIHQIYFAPPYTLDAQVQAFVAAARAIAQSPAAALTLDNPQLQHLLNASANRLLTSLDHLVNQYQTEAEAKVRAIDAYQVQLYEQATMAQQQAQAQAQDLQQMLTQLQSTQQQLVHAEKMSSLGQLVAGIAHEINNPLSFIHGNLSYVQEYTDELLGAITSGRAQGAIAHYQEQLAPGHPLSPTPIDPIDLDFIRADFPQLIQSMYLGTRRIKAIVEGLRNFARLDEDSLKQVPLQEGIESTLLILHHALQGHGPLSPIQVQRHYHAEPLNIECYPGQINQVLMNILRNAIDALGEAATQRPESWQPQLILETRRLDTNWVEINIIDNGLGIPEAIQNRIFDPFFTTKPIGSGTGLGLSTAHQIVVDVHHGQLTCTTNAERGTTFTIQLPICAQLQSYGNVIPWPKTHSVLRHESSELPRTAIESR
ncbi:MAG: ATP-binding protein [Cyanobacteria bacterium P01_G01_bin.54]